MERCIQVEKSQVNDDMLELRMWRDGNIMHGNCLEDMNKLKAERDEARRMYCDLVSKDIYHRTAGATCKTAANNLKWDCYKKKKENNDGTASRATLCRKKCRKKENTNE
jgi:hypothetical protein